MLVDRVREATAHAPSWMLASVAALALGACGGDPHNCPLSAKSCKRNGLTELTSVGLWEQQPDGQPYENGQKYQSVDTERALTIGQRSVSRWDSDYQWATQFEVQTDLPTTGELDFVANRPWGASQLPEHVNYAAGAKIGPCVTLGDGYEDEHLTASSLRTLDGSLLVAGERSRLLPGGKVERFRTPVAVPEVQLSWVDAGCPAFCGPAWTDPGDELWRTVGLQVTPRGGKAQQLLPGDHARFELDGQRYVFVLEHASLPSPRPGDPPPADVQLCGRAIWSLYRDGLIIDLQKAGEAPTH